MGRIFCQSWSRELRHLRRSRWDLAMSTVLPVLLLVLMAVLFAPASPRNLPLAVVDQDHSAFSRMVTSRFDASAEMQVTETPESLTEAWPEIRSGKVSAVLFIPQNTGRDVAGGRQATLMLYPAAPYYTATVTLERAADTILSGLNAALIRSDSAALSPARAAASASPVRVQANTMFNPFVSYELMILSMLFPGVIIILLSCSVMAAVGREFSERHFSDWIRTPAEIVPALTGKLAPYVLIYLFYGCVSIIWLACMRGYPVMGAIGPLLLGYLLMLAAYALFAALILSVVHDTAVGLGSAAVYASSALAFSGAFFPMNGAVLFTRSWNLIQPFTWMTKLIADIWQMGTGSAVLPLTVLLLMCVVLGAGAYVGMYAAARTHAEKAGAA